MCKVEMLRALLNARLSAAIEEIFAAFQRTIAEYEEELGRTKEENERQRQQLAAVSTPRVNLHITDDSDKYLPSEQQSDQSRVYPPLIPKPSEMGCSSPATLTRISGIEDGWMDEQQKWNFGVEQEESEPLHVKGEEEAANITKCPLNSVPVKTEDKEDKGLRLQLHIRQSEENRWAEPASSSSSSQHMTAEGDGDHCGGSQADSLIAPLSLDTDDDEHSKGDMTCHTEDTHWNCSQCGETFGAKKNLRRHMVLHTGDKTFSFSDYKIAPTKRHLISDTSPYTGAKPQHSFSTHSALMKGDKHTCEKLYKCSVCGQSFSQKQNMMTHMRIHTGEKPFACSHCGLRFTQKITLTHHIRTHTGERPFSCSVCKKGFSHPSSLVRHIRTHTGEKPFICPNCAQGFADKFTLKKHIKTHWL